MAKKSVAKSSASARSATEAKSTASSQAAITVADNVKAYADVSASNRWATIKKIDEAFDKNDPREEVINISLMEGGVPPAANELAEAGHEHAQHYSYQKV